MTGREARWTLREVHALDPDTAAAVRLISDRALRVDGVAPLSEAAMLGLGGPGRRSDRAEQAEQVTHLLAESADGRLVGYAQVWGETPARSAEVVVSPESRRHGVGGVLLPAIEAADPRVRVWAHGDLPAARAAAAHAGMRAVRALHLMSLDLTTAHLPAPTFPDDLVVRPFRPGVDDAAWLATNAAAFEDHPEQGRWRQSDLDTRMGEPWFDPAGFFLVVPATAPGTVAAYHWTKRTSPTDGEVYVVGVHPTYQGRGLGSPVTLVGLRHLREVGVRVAHLYVDGDNGRALATYTRLGFVVVATDRMYSWA